MSFRGGADLWRPDVVRVKAGVRRACGIALGALVGLGMIDGSAGVASAQPLSERSASISMVSLFGSAAPKTKSTTTRAPSEVGVEFTTSRSGYLLGLRFYKSSENTGTHTGTLWG